MLAVACIAPVSLSAQPGFRVTIDESVSDGAYSGRVYVSMVPASSGATPMQGLGAYYEYPPLFAIDVEGVAPGGTVEVGPDALWMPVETADVPPGPYLVQAVARVNPDSPKPGRGEGDLLSEVLELEVGPDGAWSAALVLDRVREATPFGATERVRLHEVRSDLLSDFHGRDVTIGCGLLVPENFDERREAGEEFPIVYVITGFGGDHTSAHTLQRRGMVSDNIVFVVPDASNFYGHSVFADSANTGPWARVLVEEVVPSIDTAFNGAGAEHRYLTGVSSGGWASLWLQLTEARHFAGCWSHVPDPVWFGRMQTVDIYALDANFYVDAAGDERPGARWPTGETIFTMREGAARETVLGPGGQYRALEAVFSPRGADGTPAMLFDRETGAIDPSVAEAWRAYDISHVVRTRWDTLAGDGGGLLAGKIRVYAGSRDNFFLELAIPELRDAFDEVGSDAIVEVVEGMSHTLHRAGNRDMLETVAARWDARDD
ncbi:MAG: alpha/beta hydrolase-fold protein [Planctomycetota bacterium]